MIDALEHLNSPPVETVAWVSVRAALRPFLSPGEILVFLGALQGRYSETGSPREAALESFALAIAEERHAVEREVSRLLEPIFDEDQCLAIVAFAGMVFQYPHVCRLSIGK